MNTGQAEETKGLESRRIFSILPGSSLLCNLPSSGSLSLPLRRPYLQGECESLERRKPFGDARLENNFASESKLVFGVNPSVETVG